MGEQVNEPVLLEKNWISKILIGVASVLIVGVLTQSVVLYASLQVLAEKQTIMNEQLKDVRLQLTTLSVSANDRWTRTDHRAFADRVELKLEKFNNRINDLERRVAGQK